MMSDWNPALYMQYGAERSRPAAELLARIQLEPVSSVVDLGCGPGNSTALLQQRWPGASQYEMPGLRHGAKTLYCAEIPTRQRL